MDLQSFEHLEDRVTELTERFIELRQAHQKALDDIVRKNGEMEVLHEKLKELQQTRVQIHSRVETILKKLEFLRNEND